VPEDDEVLSFMAAMSVLRVCISEFMFFSMSITSARDGSDIVAAGLGAGDGGAGGGLGLAAAGVGDDGAVAEEVEDRLDRDTRLSRA